MIRRLVYEIMTCIRHMSVPVQSIKKFEVGGYFAGSLREEIKPRRYSIVILIDIRENEEVVLK